MPIQSNSLKVCYSEEKPTFLLRVALRHHIAQLTTFSVDPGIFIAYIQALIIHTQLQLLVSE